MTELSIRSLQDGGFVVTALCGHGGIGFIQPALFACTTIDEALKYVKRNITIQTPTGK